MRRFRCRGGRGEDSERNIGPGSTSVVIVVRLFVFFFGVASETHSKVERHPLDYAFKTEENLTKTP